MSTNRRENHSFPRIFKGLQERTGHHMKCGALPAIKPYLLAIRFHGVRPLTRKENSSQGSCRRLRVHLRCRTSKPNEWVEYPRSGSGILTRFPFDRWVKIDHFETEFPYLLGSTNPCPTAVHMEPFSTSVFKALIWKSKKFFFAKFCSTNHKNRIRTSKNLICHSDKAKFRQKKLKIFFGRESIFPALVIISKNIFCRPIRPKKTPKENFIFLYREHFCGLGRIKKKPKKLLDHQHSSGVCF